MVGGLNLDDADGCTDERGRPKLIPKDNPKCAMAMQKYCSKYYFDGKSIQFTEKYKNGWDEIGSKPIIAVGEDGRGLVEVDGITIGTKKDGYGTSLYFHVGFDPLCKVLYELKHRGDAGFTLK
tara:strand:- start:897 stop:1265 length:369 start_codon:yes stop_codon:yes gene_type:complete